MKLHQLFESKTEEKALLAFMEARLAKFGKLKIRTSSQSNNRFGGRDTSEWEFFGSLSKPGLKGQDIADALNDQDPDIPYQNLIDNMPPFAEIFCHVFLETKGSLTGLSDDEELNAKIAARQGTQLQIDVYVMQ